jgi:hypothetical protein
VPSKRGVLRVQVCSFPTVSQRGRLLCNPSLVGCHAVVASRRCRARLCDAEPSLCWPVGFANSRTRGDKDCGQWHLQPPHLISDAAPNILF